MSDSSGVNMHHHHGHEWVVIVSNLLPFFGEQFVPLFHDAMATTLKAYIAQIVGPPPNTVTRLEVPLHLHHTNLPRSKPGINDFLDKWINTLSYTNKVISGSIDFSIRLV